MFFDRQERISWWNQENLAKAKVLIVGAGALGNEAIKNLALLGIGQMLIVDFDIIEDSNLSRAVLFRMQDAENKAAKADVAALRARELNPNPAAKVTSLLGNIVTDMGLGVYRHADVVLGCLDNIEARQFVNLQCWKVDKTWIDGGMWELAGSVSVYDAAEEKACYECSMTNEHRAAAKKRYSCSIGVVKSYIKQGYEPTTQTTSAVIGAIQAQEVVKILHELPTFSGRRFMFNGTPHFYTIHDNNPVYMIELTIRDDCLCHREDKLSSVVEMEDATNQMHIEDLMSLLEQKFGKQNYIIEFDKHSPFIVSAICPNCTTEKHIDKPKSKVFDFEIVCPTCSFICPTCRKESVGVPHCPNCGQEDIQKPELISFPRISKKGEWYEKYKDKTLEDLGIPPLHILSIRSSQEKFYIELSGDFSKIWE